MTDDERQEEIKQIMKLINQLNKDEVKAMLEYLLKSPRLP